MKANQLRKKKRFSSRGKMFTEHLPQHASLFSIGNTRFHSFQANIVSKNIPKIDTLQSDSFPRRFSKNEKIIRYPA